MDLEMHTCFFCIGLRTGCFIIGYLSLVLILTFIPFVLYLLLIGLVFKVTGVALVFSVLTILLIGYLAMCIVLLIGLHTHKRNNVSAYLIYVIIFNVLGLITSLVAFLTIESRAYEAYIGIVTGIALHIYFFIVVWSFWLKMDKTTGVAVIYHTVF